MEAQYRCGLIEPSSPGVPPPQMYSSAFVAELQARYERQLEDMREAASLLVAEKEAEVAAARREASNAAAARDPDAVAAAHDEVLAQVEASNEAHMVREAGLAELAQARAEAKADVARLKEEHARKLAETREWYVQQVRDAESAREKAMQALAAERAAAGSGTAAAVETVKAEAHSVILELRNTLAAESQALVEARAALDSANASRKAELRVLRSKFDECLRVLQMKEAQFEAALARAAEEAHLRVSELEDKLAARERDAERADELHAAQIASYATKLERSQAAFSDMERRHASQLAAATTELDRLRTHYESVAAEGSTAVERAREADFTIRKLRDENELLLAELELNAADVERLRQENARLATELERMDSMVYGSGKSSRRARSGTAKRKAGRR
ncbi:uncharacterized protein AMSG_07379 [Thecamonas trahens ATCC 50062]|uniref:Uncharacterized protein n=1 Tax=Thecamonas trahens ATCC 50062 TaxID=461836 RepID=A0A0L0DJ54_THETB|nr:hypothetical protein AMSG_07379 [Thecamonas trahens ATCC 50062]KNC51363.1 hypothetical protein AMSG_07379 [Thecamonas trahens ATCC 50062]|eukprot:XP_013756281.1 hypothetical protein AMSG_07379 [Thecamonas trahens ATCC 50062]